MTHRLLAVLALVVVIVLGASLTTVHAYQASAAERARMQYRDADQRSTALLATARADGLSAAELAPLTRHKMMISSRRAPSSLGFFDTGLAAYYNRQTRALATLAVSIHGAVRAAAVARQIEARAALTQLRRSILTANALQADSRDASGVLASDEGLYRSASLPTDYAAVTRSASQTTTSLVASYQPEQRYVAGRVAQTRGSIAALRQEASNQAAEAESRLPLLSLLTSRVKAYRAQLAELKSRAMSQPTAFATGVAGWRLRQLAGTVNADYGRTVPAKMIVVSTESQSATVYQDGQVVLTTPVTTGGPELPTDHGVFHIYFKASPFVFHSPFPLGSPYYYPPTPIQYWMPFDGQEGLHDASWRSNFGPGSNFQPTNLGTGVSILGTHGCVNLPASAAAFIWNFAPVGTTVVVV